MLPARTACEYGPIAPGASLVAIASFVMRVPCCVVSRSSHTDALAAREGAAHRDGVRELEVAAVRDAARDARDRDAERRELALEEQRRRLAVDARRRRDDDLADRRRRGCARPGFASGRSSGPMPSSGESSLPEHEVPPAHRARRARSPCRSCTRATTQSTFASRLSSVHTSHSARARRRISAMFPHRSHGPSVVAQRDELGAELPRERLVGRQQKQEVALRRLLPHAGEARQELRRAARTLRASPAAAPLRQTMPGIFTPPVTFSTSASIGLSACSMAWLIAAHAPSSDELDALALQDSGSISMRSTLRA